MQIQPLSQKCFLMCPQHFFSQTKERKLIIGICWKEWIASWTFSKAQTIDYRLLHRLVFIFRLSCSNKAWRRNSEMYFVTRTSFMNWIEVVKAEMCLLLAGACLQTACLTWSEQSSIQRDWKQNKNDLSSRSHFEF